MARVNVVVGNAGRDEELSHVEARFISQPGEEKKKKTHS